MPRLLDRVPRYRKHRASGQAIVTLSGKDFYLGPHGTKVSYREYDRLIAEWLARDRSLPASDSDAETAPRALVQVMAAYKRHARDYYRKNGRVTNEYTAICRAMAVAREIYGRVPAEEFGPLKLQAVQQRMIQLDWSRKHINKQVSRLVRMIRWAASQELVSGELCEALKTVAGLAKGRTTARETKPIKPIADEIVNKTLTFLSPVVADMVRLQRVAGMRPEEVCLVRPTDIDRTQEIWVYRPDTSKMEHKEVDRAIFLGPNAQAILLPYLDRLPESYCFSPREAEYLRRGLLHQQRVTPLSCGNRPGKNRKLSPGRAARDHYDTDSYRRAIQRACEQMNAMPAHLRKISNKLKPEAKERLREEASKWRAEHCWAPNRLRHSAGTEIRSRFGLEAAQVILGHSHMDVTQVYAERQTELGLKVAAACG